MKTQVLIAACLGVLACQSGLAQSSRQTLQGHVPAVVTSLQPIGRLPSTTYLNLAIGLPLRNREALTNQLQQIYDPDVSSEDLYVKMLTIFVRGLVAIAQDAATPAPSQTTSPPPG